jgi:opacity protein-like surface antigen
LGVPERDKQEPAMTASRNLLCLVSAASALVFPMAALSLVASPDAPSSSFATGWQTSGRSSLGLNIGTSRVGSACGAAALICDNPERLARFYANTMIGDRWGVEVGYVDLGRVAAAGGETRGAQGLNLSLVGKTPVWQSLGVFGKLGTTYARTETSALGPGAAYGSDQGFGLSYGAGVSFAFTPRLSATLAWESTDFRVGGGNRDPLRSTSLGLRYRY